MSTLTTNLALVKAAATDLVTDASGVPVTANANLDEIDMAIGPSSARTALLTVANSVTETVIQSLTIPAGSAAVGSAYQAVAWGTVGNVVTAAPTLTIRARLGGLAGQIIGSVVLAAPAGAQTGKILRAQVEIVTKTTGGVAVWNGVLSWLSDFAAATPSGVATTGNITVSSLTAQDLVLTAQWSAANAANTLAVPAAYADKVTNA